MSLRPLPILFLFSTLAIGTNAGDTWVVREDGAGPARIGMTIAQLNIALHEKFTKPTAKDEQGCFYADPKSQPEILLMVENGRLARIEVNGPGVFTSTGIQVGDTEKHALQVYGRRLKVEPHAYTAEDGGHYLTAKSADGRYGIRFETDGKQITMYYAGRYEAIQYIEGCE